MKNLRHDKIIELIEKYDIETQEELAQLLDQEGFKVTQATISRDIRKLALSKINSEAGRQKYTVLNKEEVELNEKYARILSEGFLSMEAAGNILVIKTVSGMAMAVAAAVDAIHFTEVIGCIAGDDTIMCVLKNADAADLIMDKLQKMMLD